MLKKANYIRPTHMCLITGEKVEVLRYNGGDNAYVVYYDHKGDYHRDRSISDFVELSEKERIIIKCEE